MMSNNYGSKTQNKNEPNYTEFEYLEGYYLNISYDQGITIFAYNLDLLDGKRFESQISLPSLFKLYYKFRELKTPKEIYLFIVELIKENHFKITPNNDNLILNLLIEENFGKTEIPFHLSNYDRKFGNYKNNEEYIKILTNEILRLKNSKNEIHELKEEENKYLKNELQELKSIISSSKTLDKYNENITGEKITIDELNKKFNLSIPNRNTIIIDLNNKKLGDDILNYLCNMELNDVIRLYLGGNDITNINMLDKINMNNLEKLSLINNKISDISVLERVKFDNLKELYLYKNNISNIRILENVKFKDLLILSLGNNKISNLNVFSKVIIIYQILEYFRMLNYIT